MKRTNIVLPLLSSFRQIVYWAFQLLLVIQLLHFTACEGDYLPPKTDGIVVEGWIDEGRAPVVIITQDVAVEDKQKTLKSLEENMLKWARVAVDDGEKEVVLTGTPDSRYFPPYIYTSGLMQGKAGRTYRLTVDYGSFHAEAVTTIPPAVPIDSLRVERLSDKNYVIRAFFEDPNTTVDEENYYKFFVRKRANSLQYLSSYFGIFSGNMLKDSVGVTVNYGRSALDRDFSPYFELGDTVRVKLAHIDAESYRFWRVFEEVKEFSRTPYLTSQINLPGNVKGAKGYWFGYGSSFKTIVIK